MTAQDVLVDAAERGWSAAGSEIEKKAVLDMVKVFKDSLLARVRDDDVAGVMAAAYLFKNGDELGTAVILTLEDRALFGWMKGLFKKPVVEEVPLSSITEVTRGVKEPTRRISKANRAIFVQAADQWEILCCPTDWEEAPVYDQVAGLLSGTLKIDDLRVVGDSAE